VDPVSGNRTVVSSASIGRGPNFVAPKDISIKADGSLLVIDRTLQAVLRVDPVTGDRRIISDAVPGNKPVTF